MKTLFFFVFAFVIFAPASYAGKLKLLTGTFNQTETITVTIMDENGKIITETKKIPKKFRYIKPVKGKKKIPVSDKTTNEKGDYYILQSTSFSSCSVSTVRYVIQKKIEKKIYEKVKRKIETKINNIELYLREDGEAF